MEYLDGLCKKRVSQVRQASRTELNDAIKKISHQYKTHYEEALQTALKSREKNKKSLMIDPCFENFKRWEITREPSPGFDDDSYEFSIWRSHRV